MYRFVKGSFTVIDLNAKKIKNEKVLYM